MGISHPKVFMVIAMFLLATNIVAKLNAQPSLPTRLKELLVYFEKNTKDEEQKKIIAEARIALEREASKNSLARKLLEVDSVLTNFSELNQQLIITYSETLVELFKDLPPREKSLVYAKSLGNLGFKYESTGIYKKSLPLYNKSATIVKSAVGATSLEYARCLNSLASLYERMGEYTKGLLTAQRAAAIIKKVKGEENAEYATNLTIKSVLYEDLGQYDKMITEARKALTIRKVVSGEESPEYGETLCKLADVYETLGYFDSAIILYKQDLAITKRLRGKEHPDCAYSLNNLAYLYEDMGRFDQALPLYQEALTIRKNALGEEHPYFAQTSSNLASFYLKIGYYEKALKLFQRDSSITRKTLGINHPDFALRLNSLAYAYKNLKRFNEALDLVRQALAIQRKTVGEENIFYVTYLSNLSDIYNRLGQNQKALNLFPRKLKIIKEILGEDHFEYAKSLVDFANLNLGIEKFDTAVVLLEKALRTYNKIFGEQHPDYINSLNTLAMVYSAMGRNLQASDLFIKCAVLKIKFLTQTYVALSEPEKIKLLNNEGDLFNCLISQLFISGNQEALLQRAYANELVIKAMALEDQKTVLYSLRKSGDSVALQLYDQWRLNTAFLGKQQVMAVNDRVDYFDSLKEATNQLEQQLSRSASAFKNQVATRGISTQDIWENLSKNQAAIEFVRFPLFNKKWTDSIMYAALILLPNDTVPKFVPLFEEKQLQRLLQFSEGSTTSYTTIKKMYVSNGTEGGLNDSLYGLIWKPLEKYLKNVHSVSYAPAGLLHRIAFQALRSDSSHLLIDKYQLNQMLSTRSVAFPQAIEKPSTASIWGNIEYSANKSLEPKLVVRGESEDIVETTSSFNFYTSDTREARGKEWSPLPGTKTEIDSLEKIFTSSGVSVSSKSGIVASEEEFKAMDGKSPKIMHIATHGFFLPYKENKPKTASDRSGGGQFTVQQNPMFRSGLVLAEGNNTWKGNSPIPRKEDGILTAYEIAQMDLSNTDLVVLSACATALGDLQGNEGAVGLQRAFKMAGVKQIIVSLWQVPDLETAELMTLFYKNWLGGQTTREALRSAQLKMKEKYPSPFVWGGFVVIE